jgi:hypothetical protein
MWRRVSITAAMSMAMGHSLEQVLQPTHIQIVALLRASWRKPYCNSIKTPKGG